MDNCIGIDVSKASINIHISKNGQDLKVDNNLKGFKSDSLQTKENLQKRD